MNKPTTKKQVRFWENNINPITGWVESNRDEPSKMARRALLSKERAANTFARINNAV
tara:strand:- start:3919 stop:4089 length:171 start_codon:yes stop_codon:yes gene_type:complete